MVAEREDGAAVEQVLRPDARATVAVDDLARRQGRRRG